ncbi:MAG: TraR/DksA C4-type zinc finger protein [Desulfobacterales bacterium]|nr:TraR/DksA C4-type zinc finger protein [Desulfobacterales bacterium]
MHERDLMRIREKLLERRREIFERLSGFESDWQVLADRDVELEEEAQKADMTSLFDQLGERGQKELEEIDLALCRLAVGRYGLCEGCEKRISLKRLDALPETRLCRRCAGVYEEKQKRLPSAREVIARAKLPVEYKDLNDKELEMLVLEHLSNDGRVDQEELKVSCRNGVLYVDGFVPSASEHSILLQILTDVMGFTAVVDRAQTSELKWEREDRAPGRAGSPLSKDEDEITDDLFESQEKETPYMFPDRPSPEKE